MLGHGRRQSAAGSAPGPVNLDLQRADFRGEDGALYNYLSTPGLSVNVRIEEALYTLHDGKLLVNGTFMTEVHVSALVAGDRLCKWAYVSYVARELNGHPPPTPIAVCRDCV